MFRALFRPEGVSPGLRLKPDLGRLRDLRGRGIQTERLLPLGQMCNE